MSYELLVLPEEWVFGTHGGFDDLAKVVNKGYAKAVHKYNIIVTPRVREPSTFVSDLSEKTYLSTHIVLLLGPETVFSELKKKGFERDFGAPTGSLKEAFSCDIPDEYVPFFGLNKDVPVRVIEASADYVLTPDMVYRVLATAGAKTFVEELEGPHVRPIELGTFTSYMRGAGPVTLELLVKHLFLNRNLYDLLGVQKLAIYADVIREHRLAEYYIHKCGFKMAQRPDREVEIGDDGYLKDGGSTFQATRGFHMTLLVREVDVGV